MLLEPCVGPSHWSSWWMLRWNSTRRIIGQCGDGVGELLIWLLLNTLLFSKVIPLEKFPSCFISRRIFGSRTEFESRHLTSVFRMSLKSQRSGGRFSWLASKETLEKVISPFYDILVRLFSGKRSVLFLKRDIFTIGRKLSLKTLFKDNQATICNPWEAR